MLLKRFSAVLLIATILLSIFSMGAAANTAELPSELTDNNISTKTEISTPLTVTDSSARYINIVFWSEAQDFTLKNSNGQSFDFQGKYLHRLIEIPKELQGNTFTIEFKAAANISEITTFASKPDETTVQNWEDNESVCDILLFSTHADDEQLYFAGVLPLYATDGITEVQVAYFADHSNEPLRRHELLDGLWEVGVRRYPVISNFPDEYSKSYQAALNNLKKAGFSEEDALEWQVEQIRKFEPLVILGHDLKGEYGHGQHILNATLLTRAVELAADGDEFSDIAYGPYNTPKLYLHLYEQNTIELDLDTPIIATPYERFKDKTPFELSKLGFAKHKSQQNTMFKSWINGKNGQITKATQITTYSPRQFGLYRTTVGADALKNDVLENVTRRSLIAPEPKDEDVTPPSTNATAEENDRGAVGNILIKTSIICIIIAAIQIIIMKLIKLRKLRRKQRRERRRQRGHHHHSHH